MLDIHWKSPASYHHHITNFKEKPLKLNLQKFSIWLEPVGNGEMVSKWTQPMIERKNLWDFLCFAVFFLTGTAGKYSQPATWILGRLILLLDLSWNLCIPNPSWWRFCKEEWCFLGGGFKDFSFSPRKLGKMSNLTHIIQMGWYHQPVLFGWYRTC